MLINIYKLILKDSFRVFLNFEERENEGSNSIFSTRERFFKMNYIIVGKSDEDNIENAAEQRCFHLILSTRNILTSILK